MSLLVRQKKNPKQICVCYMSWKFHMISRADISKIVCFLEWTPGDHVDVKPQSMLFVEWVCPEPRAPMWEPGSQVGCSQVEEPNLSQQGLEQLCKCMNRDNISVMRPVLYHQSLQKGLKPDLHPRTDSPSVIAPYYWLFCLPALSLFRFAHDVVFLLSSPST